MKKSKRFLALLLGVLITAITLFPVEVYASELKAENTEVVTEDNVQVDETTEVIEKSTAQEMSEATDTVVVENTRLIVTSNAVLTEFYGATNGVKGLDNVYVLTYVDTTTCEAAYNSFVESGVAVEYDDLVDAIDDSTFIDDENLNTADSDVIEEIAKEDAVVEESEEDIVVAVIDTGVNTENELLQDRLVNAEGMTDINGHGTLMADIIAMNTPASVKILPIKAFDEEGKGTVSSAYFAILEAIESDVDVINLSVSGMGSSAMLTSAIQRAKEKGIEVVVSAGNNAMDTEEVIPANIPEAVVISATDTDKNFAEYSNFGATVDYSAVGTVVKDMGTEDISDDETYMGTSISTAYVSSYVAMILTNNADADVQRCLLESAEDLGEEGFDNYYGNGYLSIENIVSNINKGVADKEVADEEIIEDDIEKKEEAEEDEDFTEEDAKQVLETTVDVSGGSEFYNAIWSTTAQTINLTADVTVAGALHLGAAKTIVGNNHTITFNCPTYNGEALLIADGQKLTMSNVTVNAGGFYLSSGYAIVIVKNSGTLNATNVTIKGGSGPFNAVEVDTGAIATLNGCTAYGSYNILWGNGLTTKMTCTNCKTAGSSYPIFANNSGTGVATLTNCTSLTDASESNSAGFINSGTMTLTNCSASNKEFGFQNNAGTMTIKNGCYSYSNTQKELYNAGGTVKIDGNFRMGYKSGDIASSKGALCIDNRGSMSVSGSVLAYTNKANSIVYNGANGTYSQTAGTFNHSGINTTGSLYSFRNYGKMNISGGIINGSAKADTDYTNIVVRNYDGGKFVMNAGTIDGKNVSEGIRNYSTAYYNDSWKQACIVRKGSIKNTTTALSNRAGIMYVKSDLGTVNIITATAHGIFTAEGSTLTVQESGDYSIYIHECAKNGISNHGTCNLKSGRIYNNKIGVWSEGTVNQTGGTIYSNAGYGVQTQGTYNMSSAAQVNPNNQIYLYENAYITAMAKLTASSCGIITTATNDRKVGRTLVKVGYDASGNSDEAVEGKFKLGFTQNNKDTADNAVHTSAIRPGVKSGNKGKCILSGVYRVDYEGNIASESGIVVKIDKTSETGFWKENTTFATEQEAIPFIGDNNISNVLVFKGWSLNEDGSGTIYTTNQVWALAKNTNVYAAWDANFDITYKGNGATSGDDVVVEDVNDGYQLADNLFERMEESSIEDVNEGEVSYTFLYSYQGWSADADATYLSDNVYQPGDTINATQFLMEQIASGNATLQENGKMMVNLYAIWDQFPVINAYNIYIYDNELETLTEERLLRDVVATDKEDGTLEKGIDVTVVDFDIDEYKGLGDTGYATVTYKAVDKVGNKSYYNAKIYVSSHIAHPVTSYVRFVDADNYAKTSAIEGGMEERSLWKNNDDYKEALLETFDRLESDSYVISYTFTRDDIKASQDFVKANGIGNTRDAEGCHKWYDTFAYCKTK